MEGITRDLFNSSPEDNRVPAIRLEIPVNNSNTKTQDKSAPQSSAMNIHQKHQHLQEDLVDLQNRPVMGALAVLPTKANFETKDREEQVILVLRPHIITNLRWFIISFFLTLVPFLAIPIMPSSIASRFQILGILIWELLLFGYALEQFLMWFYNIYIVTDERVVDIDFKNLLLREISDADLDKIQDVTISSSGVFAALFHYGNIQIQTAGERQEFEFIAVPQPERVTKVIRDLIEYNELKEGKATGL